MAVNITEDLVQGADSEITGKGEIRVRSFYMDGLTYGAAEATKSGFWDEVYNELRSQKGVFYGAQHPFNGSLFCSRIKPMPWLNSRTQARVLATYTVPGLLGASPGQKIIRFRGFTQQVTTQRYLDRSLIQVTYKAPGSTEEQVDTATVSSTKALGELTIEREVTTDPEPHLVYLNKINSTTYRGQPKWTWLCAAIDIDPVGSGRWRERIVFLYDEETWIKPALYIVEATGKPPSDVFDAYSPTAESGNGFVNARVHGEANFSQLA